MTLDFGLIGAGISCAISAGCVLLVRRQNRTAGFQVNLSLSQLSAETAEHTQLINSLNNNVEGLQTSMCETDNILREGRLNRSSRSQAFEMLRSGISPDSAASKLGLARREVKLMARVSQVLSAYK